MGSKGMARRTGIVWALCLVLGAFSWCGAASPAQYLVLRDAADRQVFATPLGEGKTFGIRFIHSVALSPVEEWFRAGSGIIVLERTVYQDFGAGLPHEPGPGQKMTFGQGKIEISGYDMPLPRLDVRVGRVARHALLLPEGTETRSLPLETWAKPGAAVTFSLETRCP